VYLIIFFKDLVQDLAQGFSVRNKDIVSLNYNSPVFNISEVPESNIIKILGQLKSSRAKVKSSHLYLYRAFYNADCVKAALQC